MTDLMNQKSIQNYIKLEVANEQTFFFSSESFQISERKFVLGTFRIILERF